MKISVIGAGNVGATLAMRIVESNIADVVLVDIVDGLAKGKAVDISDASPIIAHEKKIEGTEDFSQIKGSDVVVMTAGLARKPGMSRDDLVSKNASIIGSVAKDIKEFAPDAVVIVVTNPLDVMTFHMLKSTGFDKSKVMGMAGTLDSSRFINIISEELKVPRKSIETFVLACHGDSMVPVLSATKVEGKPLTDLLSSDKINELVNRTKFRGGEIVGYLKTGSAYYSTSAGILQILMAIKDDSDQILPVSAYLQGEYDIEGCCLGVPAKIGKTGIKQVVNIELSEKERTALSDSAEKTLETLTVLG